MPIYICTGNQTRAIVIGVAAAILLAADLLPPSGQTWRSRGRIISIYWVFLSIDSPGVFFSLTLLVAQRAFDVLGGLIHIIW
jgi:hypothetical protein